MKHIITDGTLIYNLTCKYCGCNFDYETTDIEFRYDSQSIGIEIPGRPVVTCPYCNADLPHYGRRM